MPTLRLHQMTWLAEGVVRLDLVDPAGAALPAWEPGAHLSFRLTDGLVREYSLCGDPADRSRYAVAVQRERNSRGGSAHVHERLRAGDLLEVDGPRNHFALVEAPAYLLVAGGIGITPIRAMVGALGAKAWRLFYCGQSRARMAFAEELSGRPNVTLHADDEAGRPPDLAAVLAGAPKDALVYCCGPEPLIQAVERALDDPARLRVERFRAAERPRTGADSPFTVVCSGREFAVEPGVSILETLRAGGLDVPSSCEEGICGTCETGVLAGEPDHRDFLLTEEEKAANQSMMLCVSRSRTPRLVLDL
ncbi:PDR/VanB family oxidoreductase [Streptosporangium carneum]|uniref:Ferredoxin n=1 Tax=Streptosporangium carneum TaxID=47481 RepID=A0A9W6I2V2_9ACTN|nr:PDR/VanB family oxidoreductase [Streptosporangium carneum]GLK10672.1 ferredoxin [Streptosporangium carneum]